MTKQELMETHTVEQLAEMVIEIQNELNVARNFQNEVLFEERIAENIRKTTGMNIDDIRKTLQDTKRYMNDKYVEELQSEVEKYRKAFEEAKKERDCRIAEYRKKIDELTTENDRLKGGVDGVNYQEKQDKTNNFYSMYTHSAKDLTKDDLLMFLGILTKELIENGIDFRYEMEKELKVWDIKIKGDKDIADFLPTEPIKVADMLINATYTREKEILRKHFIRRLGIILI